MRPFFPYGESALATIANLMLKTENLKGLGGTGGDFSSSFFMALGQEETRTKHEYNTMNRFFLLVSGVVFVVAENKNLNSRFYRSTIHR